MAKKHSPRIEDNKVGNSQRIQEEHLLVSIETFVLGQIRINIAIINQNVCLCKLDEVIHNEKKFKKPAVGAHVIDKYESRVYKPTTRRR